MCIIYWYRTHSKDHMRTNIEIDDKLMAEAQKASGQATKKQTVEQALRLLVTLRVEGKRNDRCCCGPLLPIFAQARHYGQHDDRPVDRYLVHREPQASAA